MKRLPTKNSADAGTVNGANDGKDRITMKTTIYSTTYSGKKEALKTICAIVALLMVITAGIIGLILEKQPTGYDMEYPIVNQHVNWSGAGYSGIYATGD